MISIDYVLFFLCVNTWWVIKGNFAVYGFFSFFYFLIWKENLLKPQLHKAEDYIPKVLKLNRRDVFRSLKKPQYLLRSGPRYGSAAVAEKSILQSVFMFDSSWGTRIIASW